MAVLGLEVGHVVSSSSGGVDAVSHVVALAGLDRVSALAAVDLLSSREAGVRVTADDAAVLHVERVTV